MKVGTRGREKALLCHGRLRVNARLLCAPPQAPHCEHAFCNACITQWFSQQQTCPVDRSVVTVAHLRPVPRIMRNMLSKLQITCDNAVFGCTAVVRLDNLMSHLNDCEHNPKRPVTCEQGCG
ncbi:hypothetical protein llap_21444 [Limosa lapponica baueri]|uniref:RING-type domain-containing protein n=1 Tax=Limosa lapponica baueri TaxID=1758121 RepID=A0A2I0T394_LIMLA|nr:hypothetical protein llap_21444 [Limosa lapponica baueri]